jgi:hypothetical protein
MDIKSVVTETQSYDLFSVKVRALNVEEMVRGTNPAMNKKQTG